MNNNDNITASMAIAVCNSIAASMSNNDNIAASMTLGMTTTVVTS